MHDEVFSVRDERQMGMTEKLSPQRPVRVWLVDDNEAHRHLCARLLGKCPGLVCDCQFGTAEALILTLQQGPGPDAILLDIGLPGMSGVDAVPIIKSLSAATAVLMYSTFFSPAAAAQARAGGAWGYLTKRDPFESVVKALHEVVGRPTV